MLINTEPAVLPFSKPDGLLTTGGDYFNCVIVTWLRDDSVSCRYFKGRFLTSISLQHLICTLCLYVVAFGHVFEVGRLVFLPPAFLCVRRRQCSVIMESQIQE